jgi:hypothetical protein
LLLEDKHPRPNVSAREIATERDSYVAQRERERERERERVRLGDSEVSFENNGWRDWNHIKRALILVEWKVLNRCHQFAYFCKKEGQKTYLTRE